MIKYNILVDFEIQGYNVQGNIFKVVFEIIKNPSARIVITKVKE